MPFHKPCKICGKKFKPYTSASKLCSSCHTKQINKKNARK